MISDLVESPSDFLAQLCRRRNYNGEIGTKRGLKKQQTEATNGPREKREGEGGRQLSFACLKC